MNDTTTSSGPSGSPPPPPPPPPGDDRSRAGMNTAALGDYRALRRSATDRKLAGVAGGLARHLDIDPLLIRVLLVVLVFFGGAGILLYGVLWLLVPDERTGHSVVHSDESTRNVLVIVALVVAALIAFTTGIGGDSGGAWFLSVVVIGAVAYYLVQQPKRQRTAATTTQPEQSAASAVSAVSAESAYASYSGYSQYAAPAAPTATGPTPPGTPPPGTPGTWGAVPPYSWTPRKKRGPLLFMPTLFLVALGAGVLGLLDSNGYDVPDAGYAALALATVGTMLVVGSFFGRAGGLILLGLISLGALGVTSIAEPSFQGSRDVTVRPVSTGDLKPSYSVPAGRIEIDLTELSEPSSLAGRSIEVDVNAGEIVVIVPPEVTIDLEADVRYGGAIDTPDALTHDGWGTDVQRVYRGETADGRTPSSAPLELDLEAGFGHIDVRRG